MNCNRTVLTELLFSFMHLTDKIDETLAGFWNSLFGPIHELELAYSAAGAVSRISYL